MDEKATYIEFIAKMLDRCEMRVVRAVYELILTLID